jgi:hypothetical protein
MDTAPSQATASRLEAEDLAQRIERAAAMLRDTAQRLDQHAADLRRPPRDSSIPASTIAHGAVHDVITALANLQLPAISRSAATADVYLAREKAGQA